MAEVEREPGSSPQHDERQSRDRELGNAAQPAWGAVVAQDALPTPGVEDVIAAMPATSEAGALFCVSGRLPSCLLQRYSLLTVQREIEAPRNRRRRRLIDFWRRV